jgi:hypothetical protein
VRYANDVEQWVVKSRRQHVAGWGRITRAARAWTLRSWRQPAAVDPASATAWASGKPPSTLGLLLGSKRAG